MDLLPNESKSNVLFHQLLCAEKREDIKKPSANLQQTLADPVQRGNFQVPFPLSLDPPLLYILCASHISFNESITAAVDNVGNSINGPAKQN